MVFMIVCIEEHSDETKVIAPGVGEYRSYRNCGVEKSNKYSYEFVKVK
jgi:hypothetical protein